ncbi:lipoyl synthase [bacterium]|nr:lipoyl synthase [bacterium]
MPKHLPDYLKRGIIDTDKTKKVRRILKEKCLNTVCEEARCPNKAECYSKDTATFMIMGDTCTRNCRFCNINTGKPKPLDPDEPLHVAQAVKELGLNYAVITSVTRDDLDDGGAKHFAKTITEIKKLSPKTKIEVLIPDFKGYLKALDIVLEAKPDVLNHNVETISKLYKSVRPQAIYERSLKVLEYAKEKTFTKTGIMVGLGETNEDLIELFKDLREINLDILTIGQYIRPSKNHLEVAKYYTPEEFEELKILAQKEGIKIVISSPLVRSSFKAFEAYKTAENVII